MSARFLSLTLAVILGLIPISASAQYIPRNLAIWLIVAALSPVLVLLLCVILGWLTHSVRIAARHAAFVLAWVVLFSLAVFFIENDYVIWAPLALYVLHAALLLLLIVVQIIRRISRSSDIA